MANAILLPQIHRSVIDVHQFVECNAFVSGAGGLWFTSLRFTSLTSEIEHSVANGSLPLRRFFEMSCVACIAFCKFGRTTS